MTKIIKKQNAGNLKSLIFKKGEKVEFPVKPGSKYATFYRKKPIKSPAEVEDFLFAGTTKKWDRERDLHLAVKLDEVIFELLDFEIPHDTTVTLENPINRIIARKVKIEGTLISRGHLSIECEEISGGSGEIVVLVPNGGNGENHGNDAKPAKPGKAPAGANAWSDLSHLFSAGDGENGETGENGVRGGDGGNGPVGATLIVNTETLGPDLTYRCPGGDGGDGGDGGPGGDGGDGGNGGAGYGILPGGDGGCGGQGGIAGPPGRGGFGGNGGIVEITCKVDNSDSSNLYDTHGGRAGHRGYHGTNGFGGAGGNAGPNSPVSIGSGSNGPDGDNGSSGDTDRDGLHELNQDGAFGQVTVRVLP